MRLRHRAARPGPPANRWDMLTLAPPSQADVTAFFLVLSCQLLIILFAELLVRKAGVGALVGRKLVHLSAGVLLFLIPMLFSGPLMPAALGLLFLLLASANHLAGWFRSLQAPDGEDGGPVAKSYGSLLIPLAFLLQVALLWESHRWMIQTSMLVLGFGDSMAALVGGLFGRRPIEAMSKNVKTLEGSIAMFLTSLLLLTLLLFWFAPLFTGELAGTDPLRLFLLALLLAMLATAVEALLSHGLDNFFIPVALAYVLYVLESGGGLGLDAFLYGGLFAFLLALFSVKVKFLTNGGATATFLLGTTIFGIGGLGWTVPLLTFYLLSSVLSKLGRKRKAKFDLVFEKGSQRDQDQVYANGGVAWILMVVYSLTGDPAIFFAYLGTLAAVQADTWATEIGTMWPNPTARLITTFEKVPVGTSGGVSIPGTSGAFIGSLFICLSAIAMQVEWLTEFGLLQSMLLIGFSGLLASMVDSFFGATFQAQYYDPIREKVTERTHSIAPDGSKVENRLIKGIALVNNDLVNTLCALSGSLLAWGVASNGNLF